MSLDVLIVGAGPAGVSAGLWARELGLTATVVESSAAPGGQLHHVHFAPRDVAGVRADDGPAIAARYALQLADAGVPLLSEHMAATLELADDAAGEPGVRFTNGTRLDARAVLIATGARRRRLEVPGEREFEGRGVSYSATRDRQLLAGRPVVVVGGGDAAYENALILADAGCDVTLLVRRAARAPAVPCPGRRIEPDPCAGGSERARGAGRERGARAACAGCLRRARTRLHGCGHQGGRDAEQRMVSRGPCP